MDVAVAIFQMAELTPRHKKAYPIDVNVLGSPKWSSMNNSHRRMKASTRVAQADKLSYYLEA